MPELSGVCVNVVPSAAPIASRASGIGVAAAGAAHVPLVNKSNVTVLVGNGRSFGPVTVAWSCTVVPAGTDVTTPSFASWITVTVLDATVVTSSGSHGPVEPAYVPSPE